MILVPDFVGNFSIWPVVPASGRYYVHILEYLDLIFINYTFYLFLYFTKTLKLLTRPKIPKKLFSNSMSECLK